MSLLCGYAMDHVTVDAANETTKFLSFKALIVI